ncbi:MAG: CAP domain-containing protein [Actinobacteria bacterium]|nr:CAP domain-containing protein [Actinomycetota bacterium]
MKSGVRGALYAAIVLLFAIAALLAGGCLDATVPATETTGGDGAALEAELQGRIEHVQNNAVTLATDIHALINAERAANGLEPLQWDQALASIAYGHSGDMAARDYFDHLSPEGDDFADRYEEAGYDLETQVGNTVYVGGENLLLTNVVRSYTYEQESGEVLEYAYSNLEEIASEAVKGWMESPDHRENILTPFTREGIGIYVTPDGEIYITENFS